MVIGAFLTLRCPILRGMTLGNGPQVRTIGQPSWASPARFGLLGLAVQAVAALIIWMLVGDRAGPSWSTRDFREWLTLSIALAVLPAALVAVALGCAVFVAYAVGNSA